MIYVNQKNVLILGAGKSGQAVADLLQYHGAFVTVYDNNEALNDDQELLSRLKEKKINYLFTKSPVEDAAWDFAVISPGFPSSSSALDRIRRKVYLVSEIEVAYWFAGAPVIAVTGSNGKTTVTTLINELLRSSRIASVACGNIGYSFSRAVLDNLQAGKRSVYVVESSSFQLENIYLFSPNIAVLINITPDHMDRYRSFNEYRSAKLNILNHQSRIQKAVLNVDDVQIRDHARSKGETIRVSRNKTSEQNCWFEAGKFHVRHRDTLTSIPRHEIILPGAHNESNIMLAVSAILPYVKTVEPIFKTLQEFKGIPHRIEFCGRINGAACYNDSKATNLDSVLAAVKSFPSNIHLILGGHDKNGDFTVLQPWLDQCKAVYVIGEAAQIIEDQLYPYPVVRLRDLAQAVDKAAASLQPADVLLLSPGCASFDQYRNFEERGDHFKELVNKYQ